MVFVRSDQEGWLAGRVLKQKGETLEVELLTGQVGQWPTDDVVLGER